MGLRSPGGENLLDFLELRQVLSTYDGAILFLKMQKYYVNGLGGAVKG